MPFCSKLRVRSAYDILVILSIFSHLGAEALPQRDLGTTYSTSIGPWSQCTSSCVRTRSVLCLDDQGLLEREDHCGDSISELRHYESCTGGKCHKEPTTQPTHAPLSHLDRAPRPGHPVPKPTQKPKNNNEGGSNGYLVNSGILTTLIDETKSPTLHPTFYPTALPIPQPTRTYAPTSVPTPVRPSLIGGVFLWVFASSNHLVIAMAALLLALSSVLCLVLIKRGNQVHGEGDAAGKYERVSLMVDIDADFDFPEDRDNPFEYFNGDDDKEDLDDLGSSNTSSSSGLEMAPRLSEPSSA